MVLRAARLARASQNCSFCDDVWRRTDLAGGFCGWNLSDLRNLFKSLQVVVCRCRGFWAKTSHTLPKTSLEKWRKVANSQYSASISGSNPCRRISTFRVWSDSKGFFHNLAMVEGVSKNNGIHSNRVFPWKYHPFWGTPNFGNIHESPQNLRRHFGKICVRFVQLSRPPRKNPSAGGTTPVLPLG